ncbi:MAG: SRPBCC domain-containing protein [Ferruginibacter sp.]
MTTKDLIVERLFDATVPRVWQAITDKSEMKKWYFDLEEFIPKVGFTFQFLAGEDEGKKFLHFCEITEVVKEKKLSYSWRYDGLQGNSFVTFELFKQDDKTLLKLTHKGLETFAEAGPDFAKESFSKGWNYFLYDALKNYLEPDKPGE